MTRTATLALIPMLMATTALAGPATQAEADHIVQVFQTYFGATEGVVSVTPNGDTYALKLDATPLFAMAKDTGASGTMTPLEMTLTDNGDGTWGVVQDQAISVTFGIKDAGDVKYDIASLKSTGTFDEKLMTFSTNKGEITGIKMVQNMQAAGQPSMPVEMSMAAGTFEQTATAGASGGVDLVANVKFTGLSETVTTPASDSAPAMPITVKAEGISEDIKGAGFRVDGIYKALAWVVAHPDQAAMDADKANLKTILTAALPVFNTVVASGTLTKVSVETPVGAGGIDEISFEVEANGAVADGKVREAFTLSGLTLPAGIVPEWALPILPQKVSIDVQVTDFDLAAPATLALGLLDTVDGKPSPEFDKQMLAALLPKGNVTITMNPGAVTGDGYALTYEGAMVAGPDMPAPTGKATVTLTGADKLQAALGNAPDEIKGQAMMGFGMAQGMAKTDADGKMVWEIDGSTPGQLLVNGTNMMGGQ